VEFHAGSFIGGILASFVVWYLVRSKTLQEWEHAIEKRKEEIFGMYDRAEERAEEIRNRVADLSGRLAEIEKEVKLLNDEANEIKVKLYRFKQLDDRLTTAENAIKAIFKELRWENEGDDLFDLWRLMRDG